jgi:hypothetical protein
MLVCALIALLKRRKRVPAALATFAYVALWYATSLWGFQPSVDNLERQLGMTVNRANYRLDEPIARRRGLDVNRRLPDTNFWMRVGRPTSPCPCVVACDYAWKISGDRHGGCAFTFCLPRDCWQFGHEDYPSPPASRHEDTWE